MNKLIVAILIIVGLIHILPISGSLGMQQISNLYGVETLSSNAELLMRHRAILLALIGFLLVTSAFYQSMQLTAIVIAIISVGSFLIFWLFTQQANEKLLLVAIVDCVALLLLFIAAVLYWRVNHSQTSLLLQR